MKIKACTCWAYNETISSHSNFCAWSAISKMLTVFTCTSMLSLWGNNFITPWAYKEMISSHSEHTLKFLKVEYLSRIKYNFQKSSVTLSWDHKVSAKKGKQINSCLRISSMPRRTWNCTLITPLLLPEGVFLKHLWYFISWPFVPNRTKISKNLIFYNILMLCKIISMNAAVQYYFYFEASYIFIYRNFLLNSIYSTTNRYANLFFPIVFNHVKKLPLTKAGWFSSPPFQLVSKLPIKNKEGL